MLYTCPVSKAQKIPKEMKSYLLLQGHGNNDVIPDPQDTELSKKGLMTAKGFALNYLAKLGRQEAYEWMARVSTEAIHESVVLVGPGDKTEYNYRITLAEMMISMFGGRMNFRYAGEL